MRLNKEKINGNVKDTLKRFLLYGISDSLSKSTAEGFGTGLIVQSIYNKKRYNDFEIQDIKIYPKDTNAVYNSYVKTLSFDERQGLLMLTSVMGRINEVVSQCIKSKLFVPGGIISDDDEGTEFTHVTLGEKLIDLLTKDGFILKE